MFDLYKHPNVILKRKEFEARYIQNYAKDSNTIAWPALLFICHFICFAATNIMSLFENNNSDFFQRPGDTE